MADGIYIANDSLRNLNADLFTEDSRGMLADAWHQQATAAIPSMVADAQDRANQLAKQQADAAESQRQQAEAAQQVQRDSAADAFTAHASGVVAGLNAQQQASRDSAADQFMASVPQQVASTPGVDPGLIEHLGGGHAAPAATDTFGSGLASAGGGTPSLSGLDASQASPAQPEPAPTDLGGVPGQPSPQPTETAPTAVSGLTPTSAVTAPLSNPASTQQPIVPPPAPVPAPAAPVTAPISNPASTQQPVPPVQAATQTTAALSGGGAAANQIGARGQQIMATAASDASWLGDQGVKALQAVLLTEGGLNNARGDQGKSAGPLQFYEGGQLANFAQQHGFTLEQAKQYVEQNPEEAVRWAIGTSDQPGYLGNAILAGQKAGLQGPALATFAQQHGQVSVSPERAGQNWNALFGGGQNPIAAAGDAIANSGAGRIVTAAVNSVISVVRPSQFGMGLSDAQAYAACGPVAAMVFAQATGRNPSAQEAVALAKQVGWSAQSGMAGPASELDLLKNMGVAAHLENGVDPNKIATDVQNGNPVIISTPGHYYVVDGYDPQTGRFHEATQAERDLKGGAEWMSLDQMQRVMGTAQATLYLDRQPGDGPSVASQQATASQSTLASPSTSSAQPQPPQSMWDKLGSGISDVFKNIFGAAQTAPLEGGGYGAAPAGGSNPVAATVQSPGTGNPLVDVLGTGASALGSTVHEVGLPFGGASPEFPTGGPAAGPVVGTARQVAGFEQLAATNPQYAALQAQRAALLAQQPANAAAAGGPDVVARAQQIRDIESQMRQIASQSDIPALAQQNPNIGAYETQGALMQGAAATALAPMGLASGVGRAAAATAVDPGQVPFLGLQAAGEGIGALRHLGTSAVPLAERSTADVLNGLIDTARANGFDTSALQDQLGRGRMGGAAAPQFATTIGGAAAGGETAAQTTDPNDPNFGMKIAASTLAGGAAGFGGAALLSNPAAVDALTAFVKSTSGEADVDLMVGGLPRLLARLAQYPAETRQGLENFVADQATAGRAAEDIGNTVVKWMQDNPPPVSAVVEAAAGQLPNAPRARALAADASFAEQQGSTSADIGQGSATRAERLGANDVYGGAEPPVEPGQQFTRDPQGNIVPIPEEQPADVAVQGLINEAKARGIDTSSLEAQLGQRSPAPAAPMIDVTDQLGRRSVPLSAEERALRAQFRSAPPLEDQAVLLTTPPTPDAVPLQPDQVMQHLETLDTAYAQNDARAAILETRLANPTQSVVRPTWAVGWTNDQIRAAAERLNLNPYQEGWADQLGAGEQQKLREEMGTVGSSVRAQTPPEMRAELQQLRVQNDQIRNATEQVWANPDASYYAPRDAGEMPFEYPSGANAALEFAAGPASESAAVPATDLVGGTTPATEVGRGTPAQAASGSAAPPPNPANPPAVAAPQPAVPSLGLRAPTAPVQPTAVAAVPSLGLRAPAPTAAGAGVPPVPPAVKPPVVAPPPPPTGPAAAVGAVPPSPPTGSGASLWDFVRALRVGSLAGGVSTISHIALNAPLQTAWKLLGDVPTSVVTGHAETIPLEFMGAWQGMRGWASNAATTLTTPSATGLAAKMGGGAGAQAVETGLLGLVKTHPVIQDMARQIGTSMELWRQAGAEATNAGLARYSPQWWQEVQRLTATPTPAMADAAQAAGDTFALGGKMGTQGQALADWLNKPGNNLGHLIVPFYNIGYHVATQGIERSPLGAIGTVADLAKLAVGKGPYAGGAVQEGVTPLALRLRNNAIGTGLSIEAYHQASLGNITGNGPDDPKLKADLLATGWQPDSVRIGGRYFGLHVLGPLGWPLATAANLYEATHTGDQGGYAKPDATTPEQYLNFAARMGQYGENETFLQGIGQILQALGSAKDFGRLGEREAASLLQSLIPQGALLANAASVGDPYTRRPAPGDIGQALENRIPLLRQILPPKLTPTGQPVPNPSQGLGLLLPRSSIAAPDPVITAMGQAGIGAPVAPKIVPLSSKYDLSLTPDEQQRWLEIHGQTLNSMLSGIVSDPNFQAAPIDRRRQLIQTAMAKAGEVAAKTIASEMPGDQLAARAQLKTAQQAGNRVTLFGAP